MSFMNAKEGDTVFEGKVKVQIKVIQYDKNDDDYRFGVEINGEQVASSSWLQSEEEVNDFLSTYDPARNLEMKKKYLEQLKNEIKELEGEIAQIQ